MARYIIKNHPVIKQRKDKKGFDMKGEEKDGVRKKGRGKINKIRNKYNTSCSMHYLNHTVNATATLVPYSQC